MPRLCPAKRAKPFSVRWWGIWRGAERRLRVRGRVAAEWEADRNLSAAWARRRISTIAIRTWLVRPARTSSAGKFALIRAACGNSFPKTKLLIAAGAEGYVGSPLLDSSGRCLGLICAITKRPLENAKLAEALLKIFATRAATELERKNYEDALAHSEERFRAFVDPRQRRRAVDQAGAAGFHGYCPKTSRSSTITDTRMSPTATIRRPASSVSPAPRS